MLCIMYSMVKRCHWCTKELRGITSQFVHCPRCNQRRLTEGLDNIFDPCPVCMNLKSKNAVGSVTGGNSNWQ